MYIKNNREQKAEDRKYLFSIVLLLASCFYSVSSYAQCAMCRAALESEGNNAKAEAVNDGIVYLMVIPYILVGVIAYMVYRTGKKLAQPKE